MNAQCATCGTQIRVDDSKLGERGARIRCPTCGATVVFERPRTPPPVELETDATVVSRPSRGGAGGRSQGPAAPAARGRTRAAVASSEPELVDDDDLVLVEDDVAPPAGGRAAAGRAAGRPSRSPSPADNPAADTKVASAPNLARSANARSDRWQDEKTTGGVRTAVRPSPVDAGAEDERLAGRARPTDGDTGSSRRLARRTALSIAGTATATLLAASGLAIGVLVFMGGGRIDERLFRLDRSAWRDVLPERPLVQLDGLRVVSMRSFAYPTRAGSQVLVFTGEVKNVAADPRRDVVVVGELRDASGRLVASARAPLGISLSPFDLSRADDPAALAATVATQARREALPPGAVARFTVVLAHPPPQLDQLRHEVSLALAEPPRVVPAPAPPPEADAAPSRAKLRAKGKAKVRGRAREAGGDADGRAG